MKRLRMLGIIFTGLALTLCLAAISRGGSAEQTTPLQRWSPLGKQNSIANDLIVDGEDVTVEGGEYGTILVKNDGKLTINGDTWAKEVVLLWGEMIVNGSLNVAENVTIERNVGNSILTVNGNLAVTDTITVEENAEPNVLTVYGNNNSAKQININGGTFNVLGTWTVENMLVSDGAKADVIYAQGGWPDSGKFILYCDQLTVEEGGSIDGDNAGYDSRGQGCGYGCSGGGGYGGRGGRGYWQDTHPGETYGDVFSLINDMGAPGGDGGGAMLTILSSNNISLHGSVHANGGGIGGWLGGGSGGGILMISPQYDVRGMITADGGDGDYNGGGGGGGRIKIFYNRSITTDDIIDNLSMKGGQRGGQLNTEPGQSGTIWIDAIPEAPVLRTPLDNAVLTGTPTFRFKVEDYSAQKDHRDDDLSGIIELSTDNFKTIAKTYDQNESLDGWSDYSYKSGDIAEFTPPQPLAKGVRFQWRAFAKDRSIKTSSEIRSFIIKLTPTKAQASVQ